mmetsp:Transcript_51988/g.123770  ORF Transcript_51988/g.123770 Transcript_51988/m.123770 type:complete len:187 (+) Transcript_51988:153-713(+)
MDCGIRPREKNEFTSNPLPIKFPGSATTPKTSVAPARDRRVDENTAELERCRGQLANANQRISVLETQVVELRRALQEAKEEQVVAWGSAQPGVDLLKVRERLALLEDARVEDLTRMQKLEKALKDSLHNGRGAQGVPTASQEADAVELLQALQDSKSTLAQSNAMQQEQAEQLDQLVSNMRNTYV